MTRAAVRPAAWGVALLLAWAGPATGQADPCAVTEPAYAAAIAEGRAALRELVDRGEVAGVAAAVAVGGRVVWSAEQGVEHARKEARRRG